MGKLIQHFIKLIGLLSIIFLVHSCGGDTGTTYLIDEVKPYYIDTTITSFNMISSTGITESFNLDNRHGYHYFMEWGTDGDTWGEMYCVSYTSVVNRYFLSVDFWANTASNSDLRVQWNYENYFYYGMTDEYIDGDITPKVTFPDSMVVADKTYYDIISVDFSNDLENIGSTVPVISYFSGHYGLIKFILQHGVYYERENIDLITF